MISRKTISRKKAQKGQAIVMVTLALIAMAGMLGLAVDLGWSYFVKKSAQAAADSGALAAITAGQRGAPGNPPYTSCPSALTCTSQPTACSSISTSSNLWSACLYAQQNGFTDMNAVFVDADIPSHRAFTPLNPAAGTVHVFYWVTVRVNRQIPQLFSAVLNNTTALVSARATGALTDTVVQGSLILLNRENDSTPFMAGTHGVDLVVAGNAPVQAPAGMLISSTNCGQHVSTNCANTADAAAQLQGTQSSVTNTSYTYFRGNGGWDNTGNPTWTNAPVGGKPDGPSFYDPFSGRGQPPLQSNITTPAIPVIGGTLPAGTYGSGAYFAATGTGCSRTNLSQCTATGAPITITGNVTFSGGNFGQFIFYGGLYDQRKNVTLGPGMYVLAGTTSASTPVLNLDNNSNVTDGGPVEAEGSTAGEMLVFTDLNYPGLSNYTPQAITDYNTANPGAFQFGSVGFKAGNNTTINIHGLDQSNSNLPSNLDTFAPVVFWQDQANSSVAYDSQGNVLFNPNGIVQGCPTTDSTLDSPCPGGVGVSSTSPGMTLDAHANIDLYGAIYQPRGGWITMQGNGGITGPIQLITGAINDQGGTALTLTGLSNPVTTVSAALIE